MIAGHLDSAGALPRMRIISLNLNGIRSAARKGFYAWLDQCEADFVCVQEVRASQDQIAALEDHPSDWNFYLHEAEKPGYSGVGLFSRKAADSVHTELRLDEFNAEGRYLEARFAGLKVVSAYFPSGSSGPERQAAKYRFLDEFTLHMEKLAKGKDEVVICGDWNIAHRDIDICNHKSNKRTPGFLPSERAWLTAMLSEFGWVDAFRHLYPDEEAAGYTWWSNRGNAFANNVGWRIDYQLCTPGLAGRLQSAQVYKQQRYSDHAPLIVDYADAD